MPSGEALNLIFFLSFPFAQQHLCPPGAEPVPHIPVPVCDVLAWGWLTAAAQIIIWSVLTWQLLKRGEDEAQDAFFIAPASSLPAAESQGGMQDAERLADPKPFWCCRPTQQLRRAAVVQDDFFGTEQLADNSPPPAALSSRDRSHIICLLTINKAVGCRELLRAHNAV